MKILFITPFFHPVEGGVERHVYYLAKELIKKNHDVEVFTSDLSRTGKISVKEEVHEDIKIKRFDAWFKIGDFASFWPGLFNAVNKSDVDIIHVHSYRHPHNLSVLFTNKPALLTLHWPNYPKGLRKGYLDKVIPIFDKSLGKFLFNHYKILCAVSQPEVEWIKSFNIDENKIKLTPNGIPEDYLKKRRGKSFRKKYRLNHELVILSLGRLHKSKGFDQIINVANNFVGVKFIIAGEGDYRKELEKLIKEKKVNNIILTGSLSEKEKLEAYAACDVFLHPSHYEAFGIVVLEAMSQGKPVIVSDQGGLPWVAGDAGLVFKINNSEDLKEKLMVLVKDVKLRKKLGLKAYSRAKKFTWNKITENLERIYKNVKS